MSTMIHPSPIAADPMAQKLSRPSYPPMMDAIEVSDPTAPILKRKRKPMMHVSTIIEMKMEAGLTLIK